MRARGLPDQTIQLINEVRTIAQDTGNLLASLELSIQNLSLNDSETHSTELTRLRASALADAVNTLGALADYTIIDRKRIDELMNQATDGDETALAELSGVRTELKARVSQIVKDTASTPDATGQVRQVPTESTIVNVRVGDNIRPLPLIPESAQQLIEMRRGNLKA